ncbi:MAG TPA: hydroxymethylbilane synthase [Flavitalea sp.]|nr:hydroxymethylbilane synthase [Flavitalea sp.]
MQPPIRIGTRDSELALCQANRVKSLLEKEGAVVQLVPIKSEGDLDVKTPLYEMGVQGIFTRALDIALLNNRIDLAVHSFKDVPVKLAAGIIQAAVLKRDSPADLLVCKSSVNFLAQENYTALIATSSIRRKAQWLHRYPNHRIENLRGNVNTRLEKLKTSAWDAAIFAKAGLERINKIPTNVIELDWMIPAPAQGAIVVVARIEDAKLLKQCHALNDCQTELCTRLERQFLQTLLGGCSTPISALAYVENSEIIFKGNIMSPDGRQVANVNRRALLSESESLGKLAANEMIAKGGEPILKLIQHDS